MPAWEDAFAALTSGLIQSFPFPMRTTRLAVFYATLSSEKFLRDDTDPIVATFPKSFRSLTT